MCIKVIVTLKYVKGKFKNKYNQTLTMTSSIEAISIF